MKDELDQILDNVFLFQKKVLNSEFPNAKLSQSIIYGSKDIIPTQFNGEISTYNIFDNTKYEVVDNPFFIHFTSIGTFNQIINSGFLRMSDFNCLSDKTELLFSSQLITKLNEDQKIKIGSEKQNLFSLSACLSNESTLNNEHMWSQYASGGSGCAIEYQFNEMNIHRLIFGMVKYGKAPLKPLKRIVKYAEDFKEKYNLSINDLPFFLLKISAFHKDIKYKQEKEVRLLFHKDDSIGYNTMSKYEYRDFYSDNVVRNFIKIPVISKNKLNNSKSSFFPSIEITRVIIGKNNPDIDATISQLFEIRKETKFSFEIWVHSPTKKLIKVI